VVPSGSPTSALQPLAVAAGADSRTSWNIGTGLDAFFGFGDS
jgi:hypothetical protein